MTAVAIRLPAQPRNGVRRARDSRAGVAPRLAGPACIVASCVSLQTGAALATTVFAGFGPVGTGALRFAAAALVLLAVARPRLRGRSAGAWRAIVALGVATAATNALLYEAIARIPLGTAGTLVFLGPLVLALAASRRRLDLAWALGAAAGVVLITGGPSGGLNAGVAFAAGAAACVAVSVLAARRVGARTEGVDGLALAIAVAAVLTAPVGVPAALAHPQLVDLAVIGAVGILSLAVPYALELSALRRVGVKTYSILMSLDPAIAGLAGLLLLGQHLDPAVLAGMGLVIAASAGAVATQPAG
jgi:inner membrane transporter RhtA